ncbi:MAG: Maf family protein [Candidatus Vogelbacteria bacterium]|nr:Maf family protein [Candidatus Vogelbacteria bacterium]
MKIILGSSSEWRQKVMRDMGFEFECISPDIDEKSIRFTDPKELTMAIALAKSEAVLGRIDEPAIIITSDQVVVCNGEIREKPVDTKQARDFLKSYSDYPAETCTAVVVKNTKTGVLQNGIDIAKIFFKPIPEEVINKLIEEGNIFKAAGGFISEDPLLDPYVEKIEGTEDSIMGLPKDLTKRLIDGVCAQ